MNSKGFLWIPNEYWGIPKNPLGFPNDSLWIPKDFPWIPNTYLVIPKDSLGVPKDSKWIPKDFQRILIEYSWIHEKGFLRISYGFPMTSIRFSMKS